MRLSRSMPLLALLLLAGVAQAQPTDEGQPNPAAEAERETPLPAEAPPATAPAPEAADAPAAPDASPAPETSPADGEIEPNTEATPATEAAPEALEELSAAELASLGIEADEEDGLDRDLHLSGFMDVTYGHTFNPKEAPLVVTTDGDGGSFFVGRLNLYLTKNLTETFSMMSEVRFTYAPNGTGTLTLGAPRTTTETLDYSASALTFRWGGIVIERAYGQWSPLPYLNVRAGAFLTPYGIWNVDHGTPVFITVVRPFAVGGNFFPERQTGLEVFGRVGLGSDLTAGYHLTLSNGLGPVSEYRDLDSNKAIGGRLDLEHVGRGSRFQVGGSAFYGQSSTAFPEVGINEDATALTIVKGKAGKADVLSIAADVMWKFQGLHLQAEWVGQRWEYAEAGRTPLATAGQLGIPANAVPPDTFGWGGYVLAGYRLPWWGIMPFGTLEYAKTNNVGILSRTAFTQFGLNIRPGDAVVFKLQGRVAFTGSPGTLGKSAAAQLAWAF